MLESGSSAGIESSIRKDFSHRERAGTQIMPGNYPPILLVGSNSQIFIGPLGRGRRHIHGANVALVALEKPLMLKMGANLHWTEYESTLIPAGTAHELDPQGGWCAVVYSDIYAPRWQAMQPCPGQLPLKCLTAYRKLRGSLQRLIQAQTFDVGLQKELSNALEKSLGTAPKTFNRMQQALRGYLQDHSELDLDAFASHMNLSPSRVQHLLIRELGLSYKRLQHWTRFQSAMGDLENMRSLTEMALELGFSDSSHFSNTFRTTFGISAREAGITGNDLRLWPFPG